VNYCADTWFLLKLFDREIKAQELFRRLETKKDRIIVSYVTYGETFKKLFQRGCKESDIESFFILIENTNKVQLIPFDKEIARESAKVSLTFHVPLIDACVAATAKIMACEILLSGDSDFDILAKRKYLKVQSW